MSYVTDANGNVNIPGVSAGTHHVTATEGSLTGSADIAVNSDGETFTVTLGSQTQVSNLELYAGLATVGAVGVGAAYYLQHRNGKKTKKKKSR